MNERAPLLRALRPVAAAAVLLALLSFSTVSAQAQAQARLDLRDWSRRVSDDGRLTIFECNAKIACGEKSSISARITNPPREPWTTDRQRARETEIIKRMREQSEGRIKDIVLGETREAKIDGLTFVYTEKKFVPVKGPERFDVVGILAGKSKQYIITSAGFRAEQARNNLLGFARIAALVLDQMAFEAKPDADDKSDKKP